MRKLGFLAVAMMMFFSCASNTPSVEVQEEGCACTIGIERGEDSEEESPCGKKIFDQLAAECGELELSQQVVCWEGVLEACPGEAYDYVDPREAMSVAGKFVADARLSQEPRRSRLFAQAFEVISGVFRDPEKFLEEDGMFRAVALNTMSRILFFLGIDDKAEEYYAEGGLVLDGLPAEYENPPVGQLKAMFARQREEAIRIRPDNRQRRERDEKRKSGMGSSIADGSGGHRNPGHLF